MSIDHTPHAQPVPKTPSLASGEAGRVLEFWRKAGPERWFAKNKAFDHTFRTQFHDAHFAAARCALETWLDTPESALSLILLLDQYPRNAFRHTAHMFATDGLALHYSRQSLARGYLTQLDPSLRNFMCLPFMHAEDLATQEESIALYREHMPDSMRWATEHHDIIARFGRFPHRNPMLGRTTTPEEAQYLADGGFAG